MTDKTREEIQYDLFKKMQELERLQQPGWETEVAMHQATFDGIANEIAQLPEVGVTGPNIGKAVLQRMPVAIGNTIDTVSSIANWGAEQLLPGKYGEQIDEQGFAIRQTDPSRDDFGLPLKHDPMIPFKFGDSPLLGDPRADTSREILGNNRVATGVDTAVDTIMFGIPGVPVISGVARVGARVPGLKAVMNPFKRMDYGTEIMLGGVSGAAGGYYADEEGNSSLAAEIIAPIAVMTGPGLARALRNRYAPALEGGIAQLSEVAARRLLADALDKSGLKMDEAIDAYKRLGPEGLPVDIEDAFRNIVREGRGQGVVSGRDTRPLRDRIEGDPRDPANTGSSGRMNTAIDRELGTVGGRGYVNLLETRSQQDINDLYQLARDAGSQPVPPQLRAIMGDDVLPGEIPDFTVNSSGGVRTAGVEDTRAMKDAIARAREIQKNATGSPEFENNFDYINTVKWALDDAITTSMKGMDGSSAGAAYSRSLVQLRNRFIGAADDHFPGYKAAREQFAGVQELKRAVEVGQDLFKNALSSEAIEDLISMYGQAEMDAFKVGARDALLEQIANAPINSNSAKSVIRNQRNLEKLNIAFQGSDQSLDNFIVGIEREGEFLRTRNAILGGSQTSDKGQASQNMMNTVQSVMWAANDPTGLGQFRMVAQVFDNLSKDQGDEVYKRGLIMASDILLNSNLSPQAVREALSSGNLRKLVEPVMVSVWGRENIPTHIIRAIKGASLVEASQILNTERDRLEREAEEAPGIRREQAATEARNLSPATFAVGI
jgi:hypothetical protein